MMFLPYFTDIILTHKELMSIWNKVCDKYPILAENMSMSFSIEKEVVEYLTEVADTLHEILIISNKVSMFDQKLGVWIRKMMTESSYIHGEVYLEKMKELIDMTNKSPQFHSLYRNSQARV